jgi:hypothetical protein
MRKHENGMRAMLRRSFSEPLIPIEYHIDFKRYDLPIREKNRIDEYAAVTFVKSLIDRDIEDGAYSVVFEGGRLNYMGRYILLEKTGDDWFVRDGGAYDEAIDF